MDLHPISFQRARIIAHQRIECWGLEAIVVGVLPDGVDTYPSRAPKNPTTAQLLEWEKGLDWYVCAIEGGPRITWEQRARDDTGRLLVDAEGSQLWQPLPNEPEVTPLNAPELRVAIRQVVDLAGVYRLEPFRWPCTALTEGLLIDRYYPDGVADILGKPVMDPENKRPKAQLPSKVAGWWFKLRVAGWHTTHIMKMRPGKAQPRLPHTEDIEAEGTREKRYAVHAAKQEFLRVRKATAKADAQVAFDALLPALAEARTALADAQRPTEVTHG